MKPLQQIRSKSAAFSIVELLLASAVFSILLVALLAMSTGTNSLTSYAGRNIDASAKIRAGMDRLTMDLEHAVIHQDAPIFVSQNEGNQEIHFLTRADGYNGDRRLAVVRYRVSLKPNSRGSGQPVYFLERAAEGTSMSDPTVKNADPNGPDADPDAEYDILAHGVFRFVVEFVGRDGLPFTPGSEGEIPWRDISAVIIGVAAIDDRSAAIAPSEDWPGLLPGSDYSSWQQRVDTLNFPQLSPEAARGIHIRRRVIPLPGNI